MIDPSKLQQSPFDQTDLTPHVGGPSDFVDLWLARRLAGMEKNNGPRLSASLKFDLASGLDDDIAQTLSDTGAIPPQRKPSAFSDLVARGFSDSIPHTPVTDITTFQQKLQAQGYLPPDYIPSGAWDSVTSSAARRFSDDQAEKVREGNGKVTAFSTHNALALLNSTLPSHVFSGLVGAVKGVGKSFWGSLKRISGIFTSLAPGGESPTEALADVYHHLGEDALNVLTVAGMTVGVGELIDAGRAGLGVAGLLGETGTEAAAKIGYEQGAGSFFARPAENILMEQNKSLVLKAAQRVSRTFIGETRADGFADFMLKYGPRAQAERPILRLAGQAFGGMSKAAFFPNAAAIFQPNSALGKAVKSVKPLPWYADLPTIVVHPQNGSIPGVKQMAKVFHVQDLGAIDPMHGYIQGPVSNDLRTAIYVGAYQRAQAVEAMHALPEWEQLRSEGGAVLRRTEKRMLQAEAEKALVDPFAADRQIHPEYQQAAQEYGTAHPYAVKAHLRDVFTSAQYRESLGLKGLNSPEHYQEAENISREIQRKITPHLADYQEKTSQLVSLRDDMKALVSGWQGDEETAGHIATLKKNIEDLQGSIQAKVPLENLPILQAIDHGGPIAQHSADIEKFNSRIIEATHQRDMLIGQQRDLVSQERHLDNIVERGTRPTKTKISVETATDAQNRLDQIHAQMNDTQDRLEGIKTHLEDLKTQHADARQSIRDLQSEMKESRQAATDSEKAAAEHGVPTGKRVFVMRADNPATRESIQETLDAWEQAGDDAARAALQPKLRELGLDQVNPRDVEKHLRILRNDAATDITNVLPVEYQNRLSELGYKAVAGGHHIIQWSDVAPWIGNAPKYSKYGYFWANLGLSSQAQDPRDIQRYTHLASREAVDTTLHAYNPDMFPTGSGGSLLTAIAKDNGRITKALADTANESRMQKFLARASQGFRGYDDFNVPKLERLLKTEFNVPEADVAKLARNLHGAVLNAHAYTDYLKTPGETFGVLHKMAAAMRLHGLAGVNEALRAMTISDIAQATPFAKSVDKWGFLPEKLMRGALAMRFQLNPMFEARLAAKNQIFRATEEELTPILRARKWMEAQGATQAAHNVFARVHGWDPAAADDAERAILQSGLFGYNREANAAADSWRLYSREYAKAGGTAEELKAFKGGDIAALNKGADQSAIAYIRKNGMKLFGYGPRSPLEKSVNMLFFPFSFEKKLVGSVADYLTAQPVRTMLIHAWAKQIDHLENMDEFHRQQLSATINRYAPLFKEVRSLNAFQHGIGLGEFGGVYKPLAAALKAPVDAVVGAFHPFGATSETLPSFNQIRDRVLPGYRAVQNIIQDSLEQVKIGQEQLHKESPDQQVESVKSQIDDYFTLRRSAEEQFTSMAPAFGVQPDIVTFMRSTRIPEYLKEQWLQAQATLARQYPDGARNWARYSAASTEQDLAKLEVLSKVTKTRAEQGIVTIEALRLQLDESPIGQSGSPIATLLQSQLDFQTVRNQGIKLFQKIGPSFDALWRALGYAHTYGPLSTSDVGDQQAVA